MAAKAGGAPLEMPRSAKRQTLSYNVAADTPEQYFCPINRLINQPLEDKFQDRNALSSKTVKLLSNHVDKLTPQDEQDILEYFGPFQPVIVFSGTKALRTSSVN